MCLDSFVGVDVGVLEGFGVGVGVGMGEGVEIDDVVCQFQVIAEGAVIANVTADVPPDAGTLPVPIQPVQVYPEEGDETNALKLVLLSYQLLVGEGLSYAELTAK